MPPVRGTQPKKFAPKNAGRRVIPSSTTAKQSVLETPDRRFTTFLEQDPWSGATASPVLLVPPGQTETPTASDERRDLSDESYLDPAFETPASQVEAADFERSFKTPPRPITAEEVAAAQDTPALYAQRPSNRKSRSSLLYIAASNRIQQNTPLPSQPAPTEQSAPPANSGAQLLTPTSQDASATAADVSQSEEAMLAVHPVVEVNNTTLDEQRTGETSNDSAHEEVDIETNRENDGNNPPLNQNQDQNKRAPKGGKQRTAKAVGKGVAKAKSKSSKAVPQATSEIYEETERGTDSTQAEKQVQFATTEVAPANIPTRKSARAPSKVKDTATVDDAARVDSNETAPIQTYATSIPSATERNLKSANGKRKRDAATKVDPNPKKTQTRSSKRNQQEQISVEEDVENAEVEEAGEGPSQPRTASEIVKDVKEKRLAEKDSQQQLAASKRSKTKATRKKKPTPIDAESVEDNGVAAVETAENLSKTTSEKAKSKAQKTQPESTEDTENVEIDEDNTLMYQIARKRAKTGKKSELERAYEGIDWKEVKRQKQIEEANTRERYANDASQAKKEERERRNALFNEARPEDEENDEADASGEAGKPNTGAQVTVVDGKMVVDQESLQALYENNEDLSNLPEREINYITLFYNTHSFLYKHRRNPEEQFWSTHHGGRWNKETTEAFYDALEMFGTDFDIISRVFPNRTRHAIKLKFTREERLDPARVTRVLQHDRKSMSVAEYASKIGKKESDFVDPDEFQKELEAEDKEERARMQERLEAEDEEDGLKALVPGPTAGGTKKQRKRREKKAVDEEGKKTKGKKRKRKDGEEEAEGDEEGKPKRKRRAPNKKKKANASDQADANAEVAAGDQEDVVEPSEKPKRKRRPNKKKAAGTEMNAAEGDEPAVADGTEAAIPSVETVAKPKAKRAPRKKKEAAAPPEAEGDAIQDAYARMNELVEVVDEAEGTTAPKPKGKGRQTKNKVAEPKVATKEAFEVAGANEAVTTSGLAPDSEPVQSKRKRAPKKKDTNVDPPVEASKPADRPVELPAETQAPVASAPPPKPVAKRGPKPVFRRKPAAPPVDDSGDVEMNDAPTDPVPPPPKRKRAPEALVEESADVEYAEAAPAEDAIEPRPKRARRAKA